MGELTVDLERLRTVAASLRATADHVAEIDWPQVDPDAMPGSAVSGSTTPSVIAAHATDLVVRMRAWATDARGSATAFEQTESRNADRLDR